MIWNKRPMLTCNPFTYNTAEIHRLLLFDLSPLPRWAEIVLNSLVLAVTRMKIETYCIQGPIEEYCFSHCQHPASHRNETDNGVRYFTPFNVFCLFSVALSLASKLSFIEIQSHMLFISLENCFSGED